MALYCEVPANLAGSPTTQRCNLQWVTIGSTVLLLALGDQMHHDRRFGKPVQNTMFVIFARGDLSTKL